MEHEYYVPCPQCGEETDPVSGQCPNCDAVEEDVWFGEDVEEED